MKQRKDKIKFRVGIVLLFILNVLSSFGEEPKIAGIDTLLQSFIPEGKILNPPPQFSC
ncbi:MAG: hypothetical protein VZQ98_17090 [Bacteroidales bacterium]|nr:hypothetical protein [Bacteroidales bacterium]